MTAGPTPRLWCDRYGCLRWFVAPRETRMDEEQTRRLAADEGWTTTRRADGSGLLDWCPGDHPPPRR